MKGFWMLLDAWMLATGVVLCAVSAAAYSTLHEKISLVDLAMGAALVFLSQIKEE